MYIESHPRPFTLSLEGLFSFLLSPVVSFLQPSNLQTFQRSTCLGRRLPQHSNLQPANISTPLNPNSLPFNPFADPHPLNLYATIFYKNMAGEGDAPAPAGSLPTLALSPLAATLMDLSASVANKRLTGQAKLFRCNTYKNPRGGLRPPFRNSRPSNPQLSRCQEFLSTTSLADPYPPAPLFREFSLPRNTRSRLPAASSAPSASATSAGTGTGVLSSTAPAAEFGTLYGGFIPEPASEPIVEPPPEAQGAAPAEQAPEATITTNAAKGAAFENNVVEATKVTDTNVQQQVTLKTESGVKTRMDVVSTTPTGGVRLQEAKSSGTAPLTKNQTAAHPEIARSGATVVGRGKPGYPGGTRIPPTKVEVVRPTTPPPPE